MKSVLIAVLVCCVWIGVRIGAADDRRTTQPAPQPPYQPRIDNQDWEILFDGKDLSAWSLPADGGGWEVTDKAELHVAGKGANLFTKRRYCDYVIEFDSRL